MTGRGKDQREDEFEAFLEGRGELARQLSALPQPETPQALNDAIMAAIEAKMAHEQARARAEQLRPAAANDAGTGGDDTFQPAFRPSLMTRWRVPAAMAASVVGAVLLMLQWQRDGGTLPPEPPLTATPVAASALQSTITPGAGLASASVSGTAAIVASSRKVAEVAEEKVAPPTPKTRTQAKTAMPEMAKATETAADKTPPALPPLAVTDSPLAPSPTYAPSARAAAAYSAPPALIIAPAPVFMRAAPTPAQEQAPAPTLEPTTPVLASAPAPVLAPAPLASAARTVVVTGSAISRATAQPADSKATAWLNVIDEMLKADLREDALAEWKKFRLAYPDYPVPESLTRRIAAIE